MFHDVDKSIPRYDSIVPESRVAQDASTSVSSVAKKETTKTSTFLHILSALFRPKKTACTYQEEKSDIINDLLSVSQYKKKPSFSSMSTDSTETSLTSTDSFYSTGDKDEELDKRFIVVGEEMDTRSSKKTFPKNPDEQIIRKKYPTLYQELHQLGNTPQRLCAFLAKFDITNPVFENKNEVSSSVIDFFIKQTLKNLGIDVLSNPTTFQFAMQVGKVLADPRKRNSALVLSGLQQEAFRLLEHPPTGEPPLKPPAMAFVKFVSQTDSLNSPFVKSDFSKSRIEELVDALPDSD